MRMDASNWKPYLVVVMRPRERVPLLVRADRGRLSIHETRVVLEDAPLPPAFGARSCCVLVFTCGVRVDLVVDRRLLRCVVCIIRAHGTS